MRASPVRRNARRWEASALIAKSTGRSRPVTSTRWPCMRSKKERPISHHREARVVLARQQLERAAVGARALEGVVVDGVHPQHHAGGLAVQAVRERVVGVA